MRVERRLSSFLRRAGLVTALALSPAFLHPDSTLRVIGAIFGRRIDCSAGVVPSNPRYPFDAIAVPGAGLDGSVDGTYEPGGASRIRLQAAALVYKGGWAPLVVLLDGRNYSANAGVTRRYFREELGKLGGIIPDEAVITDVNSVNTATNMEEMAKIAHSRGLKRIVIVDSEAHAPRSTQFACNYGLSAASVSAEALTANRPLNSIGDSGKETIGLALTAYDPLGQIPTFLKTLAR